MIRYFISLSISHWTKKYEIYMYLCMYKNIKQPLCVILTNLDPIEHTLFPFSPFCVPKCAHILTISEENTKENHINKMIFFFFFETILDLTNKTHENHCSIEDDYLKKQWKYTHQYSLSHTHTQTHTQYPAKYRYKAQKINKGKVLMLGSKQEELLLHGPLSSISVSIPIMSHWWSCPIY